MTFLHKLNFFAHVGAKILLFLTIGLCSISVFAQSGAGNIQGTVQDATNALIPGALIHAVNQGTGVAIDTKSNSSGFYLVPSLFAGNYTLTFSASGMKQYQTSLTLQAAQTAVINVSMITGSVSELVTVAGNAIQLATYDSGTISSTLDNARINQLPVNGRFLLTLAGLTTPGLESGGQRANGNMPEGLEYVQDGAPLTNRNFGGESNSSQAQLPDPDAVNQVRIETTNSSAQFSTPATGIITTKSGTNSFHGSLFETARNNAIGIAKARQDPSNFSAPHYVRNEFGASIGGPIRIPKVYDGRDKSFFFFAYERYSLRSSKSELVTVPMTSWRTGDFSNLYDRSGVLQTLYDPATTNPRTSQRQKFLGNKIDPSRISPLAKKLYAITPLPTTLDDPLVSPNYNAAGVNNATIPQVNARLDHVFNDNNRVFLRYTQINQTQVSLRNYPSNSPATIAADGFPAGASGEQLVPITTDSSALGFTHVFSPTFISESNVSQEWFSQYFVGGGDPTLNYEQMLGLPNNFGQVGFPNINGGAMPYGGTQFNFKESQIITNVDENLTKIIGRHQLLFGGRYRHERLGYLDDRSPDTVNFQNYATADLDPRSGSNYTPFGATGNSNADFFLGAASSYSNFLNDPYRHFRDQEIDSYFQDNFHVSSNLTINAGLRWEIHPAPYTKDGLTESFDLKNKAIVLAKPTDFYVQNGFTTQAILSNMTKLGARFETPEAAGIPNTMIFNDDFTFSPRLGVAYTPFNGKYGTVVRGGYGRFIYPVPVRNSLVFPGKNAPFTANYVTSYINSAQSPDGLSNYLLRTPQQVIAGLNSSGVIDSTSITSILPGFQLNTLDPHYPPAYVTQLNATIEQPTKFDTVLRVTYLYDHGSNLDQQYHYNNAPSAYVYETVNGMVPPTGLYSNTATRPYDQTTYGENVLEQKSGYSNDNALQVQWQRLFKHGYGFQAYWVYSRAFRVGGNTFRDSALYPATSFAPGVLPGGTDLTSLNRLENYRIDTAIPEHHIAFNGLVDLPFGSGKKFFGGANRFWNEFIGGFQLAGTGQVLSQYFGVSSSNWGPTSPIHVYRNAHRITDCRSGVCRNEKLWFNGYIAPSTINAAENGVSGLPSDYVPYQVPLNNTPGTSNYGTNYTPISLNNGGVVLVSYSPGPSGVNPFSKTFLHGPYNYNVDLSLFKVFPITDTVNFRVNMDAFNAFNIQGYTNPNSTDGTENFLNSYWTPRQIQLTARLTF